MNVTVYEPREIRLDTKQMKEVAIEYLTSLVGHGTYLREQNTTLIVMEDDSDHRHGSISENYLRDATDLDIAIFRLLPLLKGKQLLDFYP